MRVMHVSAQALCSDNLELTSELRCITDALLPGRARHDTQLEVVPQARPSDVNVYLNMTEPDILHYSGHGEKDRLFLCDEYFDEVAFEERDATQEQEERSQLSSVLEDRAVKLLVLNCCDSQQIAERINKKLGIVTIGTTTEVPDEAAVPFFSAFYRGLQAGMPTDQAFKLAKEESAYSEDLYRIFGQAEAQVLLTPAGAADSEGGIQGSKRSPQQRIVHASRRLGDLRQGVDQDIYTNELKLFVVLGVAMIASLLHVWSGLWAEVLGMSLLDEYPVLDLFDWIKLDFWFLFTFFAVPPAIYLFESFWLKRPLTEAEKSALALAVSPPPSEDPLSLAERIEALVGEFESARSNVQAAVAEGRPDE